MALDFVASNICTTLRIPTILSPSGLALYVLFQVLTTRVADTLAMPILFGSARRSQYLSWHLAQSI